MSEQLFIDWDDQQVRLLVCSAVGGGLRVRHALSSALEGDVTADSLQAALAPLLQQAESPRGKATFVLGVRDVQSRLLQVPPVPEEELPDLVRLRSDTEFSSADLTAVIDYSPLARSAEEPSLVFVARTSNERLSLVRQIADKLQLGLQHVAARGAGIAALAVGELESLRDGVHLVAARRASELDLVGLQHGRVAVVRSVPISSSDDPTSRAIALAREVRRTIPAVTSELGVADIDSLVWIAGGEDDEQLVDRCGKELSRTVAPLRVPELRRVTFEHPDELDNASGFAGLLGSALAQADGDLAIDFLSPRRAPEPKSQTTTYVLAAALAALVLLGGGWFAYRNVAAIEAAASANRQELATIEGDLERMAGQLNQSKEIAQWLATDVTWLDELDRLAVTLRPEPLDNHEAFEPDRDVLLTQVVARQAAGRRGTGGTLEIAGGVRDDDVLEDIEQQLRDSRREVTPKTLIKDSDKAPYVWTFQSDIVVTPPVEERR